LIEVLEEGRQADAVRGEGSHSAETRLQTHNPCHPPCTRRGGLRIVSLAVSPKSDLSLAPVALSQYPPDTGLGDRGVRGRVRPDHHRAV
jgi:hypothetical protein